MSEEKKLRRKIFWILFIVNAILFFLGFFSGNNLLVKTAIFPITWPYLIFPGATGNLVEGWGYLQLINPAGFPLMMLGGVISLFAYYFIGRIVAHFIIGRNENIQ